jgi:hypothetical protein
MAISGSAVGLKNAAVNSCAWPSDLASLFGIRMKFDLARAIPLHKRYEFARLAPSSTLSEIAAGRLASAPAMLAAESAILPSLL